MGASKEVAHVGGIHDHRCPIPPANADGGGSTVSSSNPAGVMIVVGSGSGSIVSGAGMANVSGSS